VADPEGVAAADLAKENRVLERRLRRMEANVRQLEALQDSNSTLLSRVAHDLEAERAKSRRLLLNVLPEQIVGRLEAGEAPIADRHDEVTVLFGDFVDFTRISAELPPSLLVEELNELFRGFDEICAETGIEKIKTVGDAYLAVGGLDAARGDGVRGIAETALRITALVAEHHRRHATWQIRVGVHTGPIVAGVVGSSKFAYDVWGDTVNIASRLESTSVPGRIHVSSGLAARLEPEYLLEPRGSVDLKGKGALETYFLLGPREGDRP
jgi:adenylate cyclase